MPAAMPPLTALKVFESAARHKSFKKAANELNVTPAAVSHQITLLEEFLGVRLFVRLHRAVALTPAATASLEALTSGFDSIKSAIDLLGGTPNIPLTVSAPPTFAHRWLVPRLHKFVTLHPEIDVQITTQLDLIRNAQRHTLNSTYRIIELTDLYDCVVSFGRSETCPILATKLLSLDVTVLCSPSLLTQTPVDSPEDLNHAALLHDSRGPMYSEEDFWAIWAKAAGADINFINRGRRFSHSFLALDAAANGQGFLVSTPALAIADLEAERLVMPFELRVPLLQSYYVARQERETTKRQTGLFMDWLLEEATTSEQNKKESA